MRVNLLLLALRLFLSELGYYLQVWRSCDAEAPPPALFFSPQGLRNGRSWRFVQQMFLLTSKPNYTVKLLGQNCMDAG